MIATFSAIVRMFMIFFRNNEDDYDSDLFAAVVKMFMIAMFAAIVRIAMFSAIIRMIVTAICLPQ